jgi:hypothetical protein
MYAVTAIGADGEPSLPRRERRVLTELCGPLLRGREAPATVDQVAQDLHVTAGRVRQILDLSCARFEIACDGDAARYERLAQEAVRRGIVTGFDLDD